MRATPLVTLGILAVGCSRYVSSHLERGDTLYGLQQWRPAIAEYEKAVRLAPDEPRGIRQLGLAHYRLGELPEAQVFLEKAQQLQPDDPEVELTLGSLYLDNQRPADAIRQAEAVLAKHPQNLNALNLLGTGHLVTRENDKALAAFRRLQELAPKDPRGPYLVGLGLVAQGRPRDAVREFEAALLLEPKFMDALVQLVQLDRAEQRLDVALGRITRQISIVGNSAALQNLLGVVHAARGEMELAETAFVEATRLQPDFSEAYMRLGELYRTTGKFDQALAKAAAAIKANPNNLAARMVLGFTYQQKGDLARAQEAYEEALKLNPHFAPAANNLAWLLSEQGGDPVRALKLAQQAKEDSPDDPHISDTLGWILYQLGDYAKATSLLKESATKLPAEPGIQYHLGMALGKTGDTAGARQALSRAINSGRNFPELERAQKALAALK